MPPDFLTPERRKKYNVLEKMIWKKIQLNFTVNNNNKIVLVWYLREAPREHTYLPKKTGIFPLKISKIRMFLYKKNRRDIFEKKGFTQAILLK